MPAAGACRRGTCRGGPRCRSPVPVVCASASPAPRPTRHSTRPARRPSARRHTLRACRCPSPARARSPPSRRCSAPPSPSARATSPGGPPPRPPSRRDLRPPAPAAPPARELREPIAAGEDPLGEAFCRLRAAERRRADGATYTPAPIVDVDGRVGGADGPPGAGGRPGRRLGALRRRRGAALPRRRARWRWSSTRSPPSVCRGHLAAAGLGRARPGGRRRLPLGRAGPRRRAPPSTSATRPTSATTRSRRAGRSGWRWRARAHGLEASRLAGLHVHFFLATAARARAGRSRAPSSPPRSGSTPTTAAWCASCCSAALGGEAIHVLEPTATPFEDAAVTAAITCFRAGRRGRRRVRLRRVGDVGRPRGRSTAAAPVPAERLREARRWSPLTRAARAVPEDHIELGELCRVHRGAVTGRNATWVVRRRRDRPAGRGPLPRRHPGARDLRGRARARPRTGHLRLVVDLPADLDVFAGAERRRIERFLARRPPRRRPPRLHRPRPPGVVVGGPARARRRSWPPTWPAGRPPSRATWPAPATSTSPTASTRASSCPSRRIERLVAALRRHRDRARRAHLRRRADQVRAARDGARSRCPTPSPARAEVATTFAPRRAGAAERARARHRRGGRELPPRALRGAPRAVPRPPRRVPRHGRGADRADGRPHRARASGRLEVVRRGAATSRRCASCAGPFISVDDLRVIADEPAPTAPARRPRGRRPGGRDRAGRARPAALPLGGRGARAPTRTRVGRRPGDRLADGDRARADAAAQRGAAARRDAVADALRGAGFREVPAPRVIRTLEEAPGPGEFCTERTFGGRKADLRRRPLGPAPHAARVQGLELGHQLLQAREPRGGQQGRDLAPGLRPQPGRARRRAVGRLQARPTSRAPRPAGSRCSGRIAWTTCWPGSRAPASSRAGGAGRPGPPPRPGTRGPPRRRRSRCAPRRPGSGRATAR